MRLLYKKEIVGSNPSIIRDIINDMMTCISEWNSLREEESYEFRLILNELISNGILHGNKGSCDKIIEVAIKEITPTTLDISIKDEGEGFDYRRVCNELSEKDALEMSEGGRGLMLVSALCSKIKFNEDGNHINITKTVCPK